MTWVSDSGQGCIPGGQVNLLGTRSSFSCKFLLFIVADLCLLAGIPIPSFYLRGNMSFLSGN